MNGIDLQGFGVRAFVIGGLNTKWGISENRVPPIWDNNLIGYWDARDLPNGAVSAIANKATLAAKAPSLTIAGATMVDGTLQFDGVDDYAKTAKFLFPERFTIFWDVDWLGSENKSAGIFHPSDLYLYNYAEFGYVGCYIKSYSSGALIPNTSVGLSTNGNIYAHDGSVTPSSGTVGTITYDSTLNIAKKGEVFTQMGFRQLLIFNKELTRAEVNEVLAVMFPV